MQEKDILQCITEITGLEAKQLPLTIKHQTKYDGKLFDCAVDLLCEHDVLIMECDFVPEEVTRIGEIALKANCNWFDAAMSWLYYSDENKAVTLTASHSCSDLSSETFSNQLLGFIQSCSAMRARLESAGCKLR